MESVMGKSGKLRSLVRELQTKYKDEAATKCSANLKAEIENIDKQYDLSAKKYYDKADKGTAKKSEKPASCVSVIDTARDFVTDLGKEAVARSGGLLDIARCTPTHSERDCARVLVKKYGLSLPIKQTQLGTPDAAVDIPLLPLRSWCKFLLDVNCWHLLAGLLQPNARREECIWRAFWCNFKKQFPSHEIFNMEARCELCLARTVAVALHGDEGRSRKHSAFLVLNFHSLLGRGLHPAREEQKKTQKKRPYVKQLPNFVGHTYTNRFMFASLRKKDYTENEGVFDALMDAAAEEARFMCATGVQNPRDGKVYWMVLVAIVGDWPWLHKSGGFGRSFNNVQKRKDQQAAAGICHLCRAGQPEFEFEQLHTRRPTWLQTMYEDDPFTADTPFRRVPHVRDKLPSLWCFDLFHSFHLGVAKNFLGSALALLSEFEAETNIDDWFETLSGRFRSWCQANRCRGHKLSKENIGWPTTGHYPTGTWHKGELTTVLMNWLESRCNSEDFSSEPLLVEVGEALYIVQVRRLALSFAKCIHF
ncbi:unnamed protein product [Effrenium voratum]|nr:unnamed protein product [Effrenium voratum]